MAGGVLTRYDPASTARRIVELPDTLACACCGATAATLALSAETGLHVCADREACRQAMIFEAVIERGETA